MGISLVVSPGVVVPSREEFLASHAPYSIALDGYVRGEPFFAETDRGPYRNFNHHEAVDRSCTCATCEQARRAVLLGLYSAFSHKGARKAVLHVNDCDEDVCLATWILMNPDRAREPLLRQLTQVEDLLDSSAGTLTLPYERDLFSHIRWVFEPYSRARPHLHEMSADDMAGVISDVHHRIEKFLVGDAWCLHIIGEVETLADRGSWGLHRVHGPHARQVLCSRGAAAAVELRAEGEGRYHYAIWRRSEYVVGFPVRAILQELNVEEGLSPDDPAGWGGADNVGGSPRKSGSSLPPERVAGVVDRVVRDAKSRKGE